MPEIKKDCFAYHTLAKNCGVMNELICRQRECTFYKTKKEFKEGQKKYPYGGLK